MNNTALSISKVSLEYSKEIYSRLIRGSMINKNIYCEQTHSLMKNPLFIEIEENYDQYSLQYQMSGMKLVDSVSHFYLISDSFDDKLKTGIQNKYKIYAAIVILVRYITQDMGKLFDYASNINYGFTNEEISAMEEDTTYKHMLEKTRLKDTSGLIKILKDKDFIFETKNKKYVLSDSGLRLTNEIIAKNKPCLSND